jgi:serine/threonine protein kinase
VARTTDPSVPSVRIDGFDDLQPIGRGGFSYVFSARQRDFNRRVALKVLSFGLADEREQRAFERECRAMGLVSQHPHIVTVFNAAFTTTKQPCIVMELYSGGTLGERLKREGRLPVATVLDVGVKIAGALQTAHDRGLLHRDIKPQNLFISEFGEPALGDFGISTLDDERSISGGGGLTVHYAPPEVLEGSAATAVSDVYSLAATLFTLLDGSRPFAPPAGQRQSVGELARRIMLEAPPVLRRDDVPRSLATLLARTMAKRPEDRPQSATELGQDLQRVQGELGLGVTPLPLATPPSPRSGPAAATRQGGTDVAAPRPSVPPQPAPVLDGRPSTASPPPPPVVEIRPVGEPADDDDHHTHTVTVARGAGASPVPEHTTTQPGDPHTTRRVVLGTVAAVVCLLAVALSLLLFGRDEADAPDDTTPVVSQVVDIPPPAPQNVTVAPAAEGQVVVAWQAVGDGSVEMRYQVQPETTGMQPQRTPELSATFAIEPGTTPCFTVVAINPVGRISEESHLACL